MIPLYVLLVSSIIPHASPPSKQIVDVHVAPRPISVEGRGLAKFVKCNVAAAAKNLRSFARSFSSLQEQFQLLFPFPFRQHSL